MKYYEEDPDQEAYRKGTMEARCLICGHPFGDHYNSVCPQEDEDEDADAG